MLSAVAEESQPDVAPLAQNAPDATGGVVVVHAQIFSSTAYCASLALFEGVGLFAREAVCATATLPVRMLAAVLP